MGADQFIDYAVGKTMGEAFDQAVQQAQWDYGHSGYSGTIAEKGNFRSFGVAPGTINVHHLEGVVGCYSTWKYNGQWTDYRTKSHTQRRVDPRTLFGATGKFATKDFCETYDDKWGPACGFELQNKALADIKKRINVPRGYKVFVFCGLASS